MNREVLFNVVWESLKAAVFLGVPNVVFPVIPKEPWNVFFLVLFLPWIFLGMNSMIKSLLWVFATKEYFPNPTNPKEWSYRYIFPGQKGWLK